MNQLTENIINIYGKQGQEWVANLPAVISTLAKKWKLQNILPVPNMSFHYVAKANADDKAVVLKLGCNSKTTKNELAALKYFSGNGSIQYLDYDKKYNALLLEQAIPGNTLTSYCSKKPDFVMDCYVDTLKRLHSKTLSNAHSYRHIKDWLKAIDNAPLDKMPVELIKKAIELKNSLLLSATKELFLHGDLHYDNILQHGDTWVAIDPKGIVGEAEFEVAAFDFMYINELAETKDVKTILEKRIDLLAQKSNLNPERIKAWVFVRLILMYVWSVEDNVPQSNAIKLAKKLLDGE